MIERTHNYRKNLALERHIRELNELLEGAEERAFRRHKKPAQPVVLIVGCARSGTTLFLQWLNSLGYFWCPTNFISRFYSAPLIGFRIQQLLADPRLSFGLEMDGFQDQYESDLGKTKGWLAPSEFWYFWRHFFQFRGWSMQEVDGGMRRFLSELAALEYESGRFVAMKAMIANCGIRMLEKALDKVLFVYIQRDRIFNAQSILQAREAHTGSIDNWWSFETSNFEELKSRSPYEQVIGQVAETNRDIRKQLVEVDGSRKLFVDYEAFCADPEALFSEMMVKIGSQQTNPRNYEYSGPCRFEIANNRRLDASAWAALEAASEAWDLVEQVRCS